MSSVAQKLMLYCISLEFSYLEYLEERGLVKGLIMRVMDIKDSVNLGEKTLVICQCYILPVFSTMQYVHDLHSVYFT